MRFTNKSTKELSFTLGGKRHVVPVGGTLELPDKLTSSVKSRGLPLEPIPGTEGTAPDPRKDDGRPDEPVARLWYDRAHQAKAAAESARAELVAALDGMGEMQTAAGRVDELEGQLAEAVAFPAKVRERLGIGPKDSILDTIDALKTEVAKIRADLDVATKPAPPPKPRGAAPASPG
jgi:hypothetical protein